METEYQIIEIFPLSYIENLSPNKCMCNPKCDVIFSLKVRLLRYRYSENRKARCDNIVNPWFNQNPFIFSFIFNQNPFIFSPFIHFLFFFMYSIGKIFLFTRLAKSHRRTLGYQEWSILFFLFFKKVWNGTLERLRPRPAPRHAIVESLTQFMRDVINRKKLLLL